MRHLVERVARPGPPGRGSGRRRRSGRGTAGPLGRAAPGLPRPRAPRRGAGAGRPARRARPSGRTRCGWPRGSTTPSTTRPPTTTRSAAPSSREQSLARLARRPGRGRAGGPAGAADRDARRRPRTTGTAPYSATPTSRCSPRTCRALLDVRRRGAPRVRPPRRRDLRPRTRGGAAAVARPAHDVPHGARPTGLGARCPRERHRRARVPRSLTGCSFMCKSSLTHERNFG